MQAIQFGVIGCGLMGREFTSAAMRWGHLSDPALQAVRPFRAGYFPDLSGAGEAGLGWASAGLSFGSQP